MKIKKNLSDAEMFRGFEETESFETAFLQDDSEKRKIKSAVKREKSEEEEILLPPETREKLNRCLLEVSMAWLKSKGGDMEWKVLREGTTITLQPAPSKKRGNK